MGLFSKLWKKYMVQVGGFYGWQAASAPFDKEAWQQDTFRATIDAIATHAAKGKARHVIVKHGKIEKTIYNSKIVTLINEKPNEFMSGIDLKYKLVAQLESKTTAMAYIQYDKKMEAEAIYPIEFSRFEIKKIKSGGYGVEFNDTEGETIALPLEDIVLIRKFYNNRVASGDGNDPIYKVLDMSKASDEGFVEALNVSNKIRGLVKSKLGMLDEADLRKGQEEFAQRVKDAAEHGGIIRIDASEEYTPISINAYSANAAQMAAINNRIYTYLRTPEDIVQNKYTEQVGQAWYEGKIEPIWEQIAQAFTNAYFTKHEREVGNQLIIHGSIITGASYQTRTNIISMTKEIGTMSKNEQRELLGLPPTEDGDVFYVSLNYANAIQLNNKEAKTDE